jgi:hypothetical protein
MNLDTDVIYINLQFNKLAMRQDANSKLNDIDTLADSRKYDSKFVRKSAGITCFMNNIANLSIELYSQQSSTLIFSYSSRNRHHVRHSKHYLRLFSATLSNPLSKMHQRWTQYVINDNSYISIYISIYNC